MSLTPQWALDAYHRLLDDRRHMEAMRPEDRDAYAQEIEREHARQFQRASINRRLEKVA